MLQNALTLSRKVNECKPLLSGSDDQTLRWWDPSDPRHSPAAAAAAAAVAKVERCSLTLSKPR
jgi:hypothetical protein